MQWLTFRRQWWLAFWIALCGFMLATVLRQGLVSNIAWVICGLLFVVHPVCPERWKWKYEGNPARWKRECRIGGAIVMVLGLITRFGVG